MAASIIAAVYRNNVNFKAGFETASGLTFLVLQLDDTRLDAVLDNHTFDHNGSVLTETMDTVHSLYAHKKRQD
jgi:hypothetical protein